MRACALALLLSLSGCAAADELRQRIAEEGAGAADRLLNDAEWFMCRASSVGAVTRRYWDDPQKRQAWADLCLSSPGVPEAAIVVPEAAVP